MEDTTLSTVETAVVKTDTLIDDPAYTHDLIRGGVNPPPGAADCSCDKVGHKHTVVYGRDRNDVSHVPVKTELPPCENIETKHGNISILSLPKGKEPDAAAVNFFHGTLRKGHEKETWND